VRLIGAYIGLAAGIGLLSPLIVAAIPNFRWWCLWFFAGAFGFVSLLLWIAAMDDDGSVGHALGLGIAFMIVVPAAACFAASFFVKAYLLDRRRRQIS
jgi:uncharacterized membrane protein